MADPVHRLSCGDEHFDLADLMSDEMAHVKSWTGLKNRDEFEQALKDEDPGAVTAAFTLVRRRNGEKGCRFTEVSVNLYDLKWSRHVDGRAVEVAYDKAEDGTPLQVLVDKRFRPLRDENGDYLLPSGEDGEPAEGERVAAAVLFRPDGSLVWRYADTGEEVPPTTLPATSGSSGSPSTATQPERSDSTSGTENTNSD